MVALLAGVLLLSNSVAAEVGRISVRDSIEIVLIMHQKVQNEYFDGIPVSKHR